MFLRRGRTGIGIDISGDDIKIVQLKKGNVVSLEKIGMTKISEESIDETSKEIKDRLIVDALKRLISELKIKERKVCISIAGNNAVVRYITLPYMTEAELKETIRLEAEDHIPFDIDQVILDYQITKELVDEKGERKIEVLLVAVKEELIYERVEQLEKAGLTPVLINIDPFALEESWLYSDGDEVVALVDIGARVTNIVIIDGRVACFNRDILFGGRDFTVSISKELEITFQDAEKIKYEKGIILSEGEKTDDEELTRISYILESAATRLLTELDRSFAYYYTQLPTYKAINKLILSGGGAKLKGLDKFLSLGLGMPVQIANPFNKIRIPKRYDLNYINDIAPLFCIGVGLALRGIME
jgi:type IV pilus assembly protein PilM